MPGTKFGFIPCGRLRPSYSRLSPDVRQQEVGALAQHGRVLAVFDPNDPKHLVALDNDVQASLRKLRDRRETLYRHKQQYVGAEYGEGGSSHAVPINVIELGVNTFQRFVSPHLPHAMVQPRYRELTAQANSLELALNQEAKRINLGDTFNTWAIEALFVMGVVEVGIATSDSPPSESGLQPGQLFVDPVLFNRLILDLTRGDWDSMRFVGHDYDVPLDWVKENRNFDKSVRRKVTANTKGEDRNVDDDTDPVNLSSNGMALDEFEDTITLRQLYLPRHKLVLTFAADQPEKRPLRILEWEGPARGMYYPLCFGKVPGSVIPNAPVPQWAPLHDQINRLWNKVTAQADRQKTVLLVRGAATADGERIVKVPDGGSMYTDDPGGAVEHKFGGADETTMATVLSAFDRWNILAGNVMAIGGLGVQSETATQDRLLKASASGRTDDMQQVMLSAQIRVFEAMAWWLWHDPISEYHLIKTVENTDYPIHTVWTPEDRQGDFTDYNFTISPFSAQPRSPQEQRSDYIAQMQLLAEFMPLMEQQGMTLDMEYVAKTLAKYSYMPDVHRSIRYAQGEQYMERGPVEKPRMPTSTRREYVRKNVAQPSQQGRDATLAAHLLGLNKQPAEQASLARVAG